MAGDGSELPSSDFGAEISFSSALVEILLFPPAFKSHGASH